MLNFTYNVSALSGFIDKLSEVRRQATIGQGSSLNDQLAKTIGYFIGIIFFTLFSAILYTFQKPFIWFLVGSWWCTSQDL